jgi:hypothetical protein
MTEFFMEKRMLEHMMQYLETGKKTAKPVKVQILQTLGIFLQNISQSAMVFYLLSNDRINALITHRFDFGDEELMAYYISFLKALSLRLNADTVHFFFNPEKKPQFPLLTEALKFYQHEDHMVRVSVRTLSLNIYRVTDARMRLFVATQTAVPFFSNLVWEMMRRYREICAIISEAGALVSPREMLPSRQRVERLLQQQSDELYFINDILMCDFDELKTILCSRMLHKLLAHLCFSSLKTVRKRKLDLSSPSFSTDFDAVFKDGDAQRSALSKEPVQPPVALLIAGHMLTMVQDQRLSTAVVRLLFDPNTTRPEAYFPHLPGDLPTLPSSASKASPPGRRGGGGGQLPVMPQGDVEMSDLQSCAAKLKKVSTR